MPKPHKENTLKDICDFAELAVCHMTEKWEVYSIKTKDTIECDISSGILP